MDDLVPCPLCGGEKGYALREGSTYRWWYVSCAACGDELGECHADRTHGDGPLPTRWEHADDHWNAIGAHAQSLRAQLAERDREVKLYRGLWRDRNA